MKTAIDVLQHFLKNDCLIPLIKSIIDLTSIIIKNIPKSLKKRK